MGGNTTFAYIIVVLLSYSVKETPENVLKKGCGLESQMPFKIKTQRKICRKMKIL